MSKSKLINLSGVVKLLYYMGLLSIWLLVIGAQLVWFFDRWHIGKMYWIETIEKLWLVTLLPMMFWGIGASLAIYYRSRSFESLRFYKYVFSTIQVLLIVSCGLASYLIIFNREAVFLLAILSGLALCIVWIEFGIRYRAWKTTLLSILLVIIFLFPLRYTVTTPGLTMDMNQYAQVESGHTQAEIQGVLVFERPAFIIDFVYAKLFQAYDFAKIQSSDPSIGEQLQQVNLQKVSTNQISTAVALQKLGIGHGNLAHGLQVLGILPQSPSEGKLLVEDVIIAMNHQPIQTSEQFISAMQAIKPGDIISLTIVRNQRTCTFELTTQPSENHMDKAIIGVQITDYLELDIPLRVKFHSYWVHKGGPSHGAMLTLALIDQLTPGGITNGHRVAGTGTMDIQGKIGPIGGIRQKTYTIAHSNADVFFVPFDQFDDAVQALSSWNDRMSHPFTLQIIPVNTIDDIVAWLEHNPR